MDTIISLSKKLISCRSTKHNTEELEKILDIARSELSEFHTELFKHKSSLSALVYNTPKRPKKFTILLNAHLDVTPGKNTQYSPVIKNNKLYGVGALDMKANAACLILAFKAVAKKVNYPLALQLTTDEELGGFHGTKHQIEKGVRADFVIAGETTGLNIVTKAKGILWVEITFKGKTAHGAYPWKGENAIVKAQQYIADVLKKYPNPKKDTWQTTINVSSIKTSNETYNKIPDDCTVSFDIRYVPDDAKTIVPTLKKLLPKGTTMKVVVKEPFMQTKATNPFVKQLQKTTRSVQKGKGTFYGANGSSDARHFTPVGGHGVEFGAIGGGIGTDAEWIDITSLEKYYTIIEKFLLLINEIKEH